MTVSKEVQDAVDQIRRDKDLISSMRKADEVRDRQAAEQKERIHSLEVGEPLSAENKQALIDAVGDMRDVNGVLADAVPANTDKPDGAPPAETQVREVPRSDDGKALPVAAPAPDAAAAPLMPNMAFDPAAGNAGQAGHAPAIETPGGFVVAGGGSVSRAVGSLPESPSSSVAVPADADAKAPGGPAVVGPDGIATPLPPGGETSADPAKVDPGRMDAPNSPFGGPAGQEGGPAAASAPAPASDVVAPPPNAVPGNTPAPGDIPAFAPEDATTPAPVPTPTPAPVP